MQRNEHKSPPSPKRREQREREHTDTISQLHCDLDQTSPFGLCNAPLGKTMGDALFDNLPKLMRPEQLAEHFGYSVATIYDWRYRGKLRGVPSGLFLSLNRRLYIRTDIFLTWIASQNPDLELGV